MEKETLLAHIFSSPPKVCLPRKSAFLFLAISPVWLRGANRNGSHFFPTGKEIDVIKCAQWNVAAANDRASNDIYRPGEPIVIFWGTCVCVRRGFRLNETPECWHCRCRLKFSRQGKKKEKKKTNFLVGTCFWLKGNYHKLNWNEEKTGRFET